MTDPNTIYSGLSRTVELEGRKFRIEITRIKNQAGWSVEVIDQNGRSSVWHELFPTDHAALVNITRVIEDEGLIAFHDTGIVVPFPKQ